jgi:hypothetical protein
VIVCFTFLGAFFLIQVLLDREFLGEAVINARMWRHSNPPNDDELGADADGVPVRIMFVHQDDGRVHHAKEAHVIEQPHRGGSITGKTKHTAFKNTKVGRNGTETIGVNFTRSGNIISSEYMTECRLPRVSALIV